VTRVMASEAGAVAARLRAPTARADAGGRTFRMMVRRRCAWHAFGGDGHCRTCVLGKEPLDGTALSMFLKLLIGADLGPMRCRTAGLIQGGDGGGRQWLACGCRFEHGSDVRSNLKEVRLGYRDRRSLRSSALATAPLPRPSGCTRPVLEGMTQLDLFGRLKESEPPRALRPSKAGQPIGRFLRQRLLVLGSERRTPH
jgi:hypothetical protein